MAEVWPVVAVWCVAVTVAAALAAHGAFVSPHAAAMRRLRLRLGRRHPGPVRSAVGRSPLARRFQDLIDLRRLLVVAGRPDDPAAWLGATLGRMALVAGTVGLVDVALLAVGRGVVVPPSSGLLLALATGLASYVGLRFDAARVRESASLEIGDLMVLFAVTRRPPLRDPRHIDDGDAIAVLARCSREGGLTTIVEGDRWQQVVPAMPRTTAELFEGIADAYALPSAASFAQVLRTVHERGTAAVEADYIAAARMATQQRIADARVAASSRLVTQALPTLGLLIALLLLLLSTISATGLGGAF